MARIRQQHPQNYTSTGNINTEFENLLRYLNSAELGNKSLAELLTSIFSEDGEFDGAVELRVDAASGLQYRVGTFTDEEDGWQNIATIDSLRGRAGLDVGTIEAPLFFNRQDIALTTGDTVINYNFDESTDAIVLYLEGVLQAESTYVTASTAGTITLSTPASGALTATVYSIRTSTVSGYRRQDTTTVAGQVLIAFPHTEAEKLLVYRNGVLQREGASNDYLASAGTDTVTFNTVMLVNELVSIITIENISAVNVGGLMMEDEYTDANGYIELSKIVIPDNSISVAKVATLVGELADKAHLTVSATTPTGASDGWLWLDTSSANAELKFSESGQWFSTSPDASLPVPSSTDALRYLRVNSAGSGFEIADLNLSSMVAKSAKGAANGVASLDSQGYIPIGQIPTIRSAAIYPLYLSGAVTNGAKHVLRVWKQIMIIDAISLRCEVGTCDINITVEGVGVGATYSVSTTGSNQTFGTVLSIDGTTIGKSVDIEVTNASANCEGLQVSLATITEIV